MATTSSPPRKSMSPPSKLKLLTKPAPAKAAPPKRPRRGQRYEAAFPVLVDVDGGLDALQAINSPFQVQEYLAALIRRDPHDVERIVAMPTRASTKGKEVETEDDAETLDPNVWLYEHMRRIAAELSSPLLLALEEHCSRRTCPEMKADEWLYLCAAHPNANEHECCAIDYTVHTLDGATALLNSSRYFPSRLSVPPTSFKHFTSISRRLYRIFAHAYFHHRDIFEACEAETSLYARFLALCKHYALVPADLLIIPSSDSKADEEEDDRRA